MEVGGSGGVEEEEMREGGRGLDKGVGGEMEGDRGGRT